MIALAIAMVLVCHPIPSTWFFLCLLILLLLSLFRARIYLQTTGHWIAASTIVPNVPLVYGLGENGLVQKEPSSLPSNGLGPTCTLGQLSTAISGKDCLGDYDSSTPVRPLRARISALTNTVKQDEMPTVVAIAGFIPAAEAKPYAEAAAGAGASSAEAPEERETAEDESVSAKASRAAAAVPGEAGVLEDGAVRGRGQWGVEGRNHLRWEFDTMNVDLGGDRISKTEAVGGAGDGKGKWGGRDLYEFFLDQNMLIVAWKGDSPKAEDAVVFVRDEVPR